MIFMVLMMGSPPQNKAAFLSLTELSLGEGGFGGGNQGKNHNFSLWKYVGPRLWGFGEIEAPDPLTAGLTQAKGDARGDRLIPRAEQIKIKIDG